MKKYVVAAIAVVVAGLVTTVLQVRRRSAEVAAKKDAAAESEPAPLSPALLAPISAPEPANPRMTAPPAPDSDPGKLDPPDNMDRFAQASQRADAPDALPDTAVVKLRREGTKVIDLAGTIEQLGTQFVFQPDDGSAPLNLLENLVLQRIDYLQTAQSGKAAPSRWRVSGAITEYRGANYLLMDRAVVDRP